MADGFIRPDHVVLPASALVPEENLISPAPNQFTHEVIRQEPYFFRTPGPGSLADGEFEAGTPVVLLVYLGGRTCRVADGRGLYVEIDYSALRRLQQAAA